MHGARRGMNDPGSMRVLLSGGSGPIGQACRETLSAAGHTVVRLVRTVPAHPGEVWWDPANGVLDPAGLARVDAAIHLSGESIAAQRWSDADKARIRSSRIDSTRLIAGTLAKLAPRPRVLVCASAMGFYGSRGNEVLNEESRGGTGFLADLAREWEAAARPAAEAGIRVVNTRFGLVLSPRGGVLERLVPIFRLGMGGPIADGRAWWSWVAIDDLARAVLFAIERDVLAGPVNVVAPGAVRNREFARTLGRVLHRPALLPVPALALYLLYGEMADEALLASTRVAPARLAAAGFGFRHPALEEALRHVLDARR